jgi:hypothetical protein
LAGLPFAQYHVTGTGGWSCNQAETANLLTITNVKTNDKRQSPDLNIRSSAAASNWIVSHAIPRTHTGNWSLDMIVSWIGYGTVAVQPPFVFQIENVVIEILDGSNKILLQISNDNHITNTTFTYGLYANHTTTTPLIPLWAQAPGTPSVAGSPFQPFASIPHDLLIRAGVVSNTFNITFNGQVTANVPLFDATADIVHPATFQVRYNLFNVGPSGVNEAVDFKRLYFSE